MAWYVESLVLDRERIKQQFSDGFIIESDDGESPDALRILNKVGGMSGLDAHVRVFIDTDLYNPMFNDILMVEKAVKELYKQKEIDLLDIEVLNVLSSGDSLVEMAHREQTDVNLLIRRFSTTCNKISYELQGHFTDAGYLKYMSDKYNLDEKQRNKVLRYMQNSRRTRIRRLINDKATY